MTAVLEAAGTSIDNVVKVYIFIADIKDFAAMNEVYMQYFGDVKPARRSVYYILRLLEQAWSDIVTAACKHSLPSQDCQLR